MVDTRALPVPMAAPAVRLSVPALMRVLVVPSSSTLAPVEPKASVALPTLMSPAVKVPVALMLELPVALSLLSASAPVLLR